MSQQHLIWQSEELEDDRTLREYHIHNGATLQLVLGMRGGPVNTRRGTSLASYWQCYVQLTSVQALM